MPYTAASRESRNSPVPGVPVAGTVDVVAGRCQGDRVSHPEPGTVVVRTLANHPLVDAGSSALRMVAPGSETAGRFGLVEYRLAPRSPGAAPHYHQTFSESFYVLSGRLTVYADGAWRPYSAGDFALVQERGVHGFRNDGDEPADFLILFAPGIAREQFFAGMAKLRRSSAISAKNCSRAMPGAKRMRKSAGSSPSLRKPCTPRSWTSAKSPAEYGRQAPSAYTVSSPDST